VYIDQQIEDSRKADERVVKGFMAGVFNEAEAGERRKLLKETVLRLEAERSELQEQVETAERREERKRLILEEFRLINRERLRNAPFEVKKEVIKTMIDKVIVDTKGAWIELEGQITGRIPITFETSSGV
jgi:hypothetical protein